MSENPLVFLTASEIRFGRGKACEVAVTAKGLGQRAMLVNGATAARADWLADQLAPVARFAVGHEPDIAMIEAGVAAARAAKVQVIVALGGGAVIDAGKAIAALVPAHLPMMDYLEVVGRGLPLEADPLPFIAVPTTAGTGAEVTKNAVIGVPSARRKVSLRDNRMLPDVAVIDPALTDGTPKSVTLASGLDAITQVIEPYLCTKANRLTDVLCRNAIPLGLAALVRLMEAEDVGARDDLAWVSLCGGLALANAGLGAVHGLAGPIGGVAPAPHGAVCGVLLPPVLAANAQAATGVAAARISEVQTWISDAFGVEAKQAMTALQNWSQHHGLPRLSQMGVREDELQSIAQASLGSSSMRGNPVALTEGALTDILYAAY
ncbi:iron-containing alcohol dehydrogenase [Paracoccaceae bacterium]|nr:iron-containing alcohol dehydrogenase [Paracoccaceae bacterium]